MQPAKATSRAKRDEGPHFVRFFPPLLDALRALCGSGAANEVVERIAMDKGIPDQVQNEVLPSGAPRFRNQVAWARFYLVREGLLDSSKRGVWSLTERGRATVLSHEQGLELFRKLDRIFRQEERAKTGVSEPAAEPAAEVGDYRSRAIAMLRNLPASGFERLSQRLLRESGFTQVEVTGRSGDEGIDGHGTLQINALVSFKVLFQCKRYKSSVSPSQ